MTSKQKNNLFKRARKFIRAGKTDMALHVLEEIENCHDALKLEVQKRSESPKVASKKYEEWIVKETNKETRLTYAPETGRVTIKTNGKETNEKLVAIRKIVDKIITGDDVKNIVFTIRGELSYDDYNQRWGAYLVSNNKLQKVWIHEEGG